MRRKLVSEVADVVKVRTGLLGLALIYPMVRFSLRDDTAGCSKMILSTKRGESSLDVFSALFPTLREAAEIVDLTESQVRVTGLLSRESHHNRELQIISVNKKLIPLTDLHREVEESLKKAQMLPECKFSPKLFPIFVLKFELPSSEVVFLKDQDKFEVIFNDKKMISAVLDRILAECLVYPLTSSTNSVQKSSSSVLHSSSENISGDETLTDSEFLFSPQDKRGRTSVPVHRETGFGNMDFNTSIQDLFMDDTDIDEASENRIENNWKNPNFIFQPSPRSIKLSKAKWSEGLKLKGKDILQTCLVGQVEKNYLATVLDNQLLLWDQHAVHERIRLENLIEGSLESASLDNPLLMMIPSSAEREALFTDRGTKFCSRWGLALTRAEDETSVFILDTPTCVERLEPSTQVDLCQSILQEICRTILDKSVLPNLPDTLMALLASQACRGAIMFGESLAKDKCQDLLTDLTKCKAQ